MLSLDATIIYRIPALLMALTVHEYAHGAMSTHLGDQPQVRRGALTMNPLAHLDIIGTLVLLLVGFGWAKPVMVDSRYYRHPRHDMMKVALAGPLANLFLCFLALSLDGFFLRYFASRTFYSVHFFPAVAKLIQCLVCLLQFGASPTFGWIQGPELFLIAQCAISLCQSCWALFEPYLDCPVFYRYNWNHHQSSCNALSSFGQ